MVWPVALWSLSAEIQSLRSEPEIQNLRSEPEIQNLRSRSGSLLDWFMCVLNLTFLLQQHKTQKLKIISKTAATIDWKVLGPTRPAGPQHLDSAPCTRRLMNTEYKRVVELSCILISFKSAVCDPKASPPQIQSADTELILFCRVTEQNHVIMWRQLTAGSVS